jgi:hypothetical protein
MDKKAKNELRKPPSKKRVGLAAEKRWSEIERSYSHEKNHNEKEPGDRQAQPPSPIVLQKWDRDNGGGAGVCA